jgi:hypothetical protein
MSPSHFSTGKFYWIESSFLAQAHEFARHDRVLAWQVRDDLFEIFD